MNKDVMVPCKDTKKLRPLVQYLLSKAIEAAEQVHVTALVVETYRSRDRQWYLYCQNRSLERCVRAGIPKEVALLYMHPGNTVTWTLDSKHLNRCAVDVIPMKGAKAIWNASDIRTVKLKDVMKSYGFEAGADWKATADSPHFQIVHKGNTFSYLNTTKEVTLMVQRALNQKLCEYKDFSRVQEDGIWGGDTTRAVNLFRKQFGWKQDGKIGLATLKKLV